MLVKNWMSKKPVTIDVNASMQDAIKLMKQENIKLLPVVQGDKLVGVVTDRDLKKASASDATSLDVHELLYLIMKIKVKDIMVKNPVTVSEDFTIEETAEILLDKKISGVPVMDKTGKIAGVITKSDLFRVIISLTGIGQKGIQLAMQLKDDSGSIKSVADIIRKYQGRIASILSSYDRVPPGFRKVYIRFFDMDRGKLEELKKEIKEKALLLYMVDHREGERSVYED
jgi:acetoin utilization protein AcuB